MPPAQFYVLGVKGIMGRLQVLGGAAILLTGAGCTSSAPPAVPESGYSLMGAVEATGEVTYQLWERGFPTLQACEQRRLALESTHDILLRCITQ